MIKNFNKQNGGAMVMVLIIAAAVAIMASSLLYIIKISIMQNSAINKYNDLRNSSFVSLKFDLPNLVPFTNSSSNSEYNYSADNGLVDVNVGNKIKNVQAYSQVLYNSSAVAQYSVDINLTKSNTLMKYIAYVSIPSLYHPTLIDSLIQEQGPVYMQNINVPVLVLSNLTSSQSNSSGNVNDVEAGFIGTLTIDNSNGKVSYRPFPSTSPAYFDIDLPENGLANENYILEQGWGIKNGNWTFHLIIYDKSNGNLYQADMSLDDLINSPSQFESLTWSQTLSPSGSNGNIFNVNDKILAAIALNDKDKVFSFVIIKDDVTSEVSAFTTTNSGVSLPGAVNFGVHSSITSVYPLALDLLSNQDVKNVLMFFSTGNNLVNIYNTTISGGHAQSYDNLISLSGYGRLAVKPRLLYRDENSSYLVVPFLSQVRIYSYNLSTPVLTYIDSVLIPNGNIISVIPFSGFVVAITNANKAYFVALNNSAIFAEYDLPSTDGVYFSYDAITQKSYINTDAGSIVVSDAPMPYGVSSITLNS